MSVCRDISTKDTASSVCPKNKATLYVNLNEKTKNIPIEDDDEISSTSGNNYTTSFNTHVGMIDSNNQLEPCGIHQSCKSMTGSM